MLRRNILATETYHIVATSSGRCRCSALLAGIASYVVCAALAAPVGSLQATFKYYLCCAGIDWC